MNGHDASYRNIFSHPQIVRELLQGFVREAWVGRLELDSLERINASYVSDDLRDRTADLVWRARLCQGPGRCEWRLYVYLLIEFQSRVDPWMALRILDSVVTRYGRIAA